MSQTKPRLPTDGNGHVVEIAFHPGQALAGVALSEVSQMTSVIANKNAILRIVATGGCFYKPVQSSGNASASDHYLPANTPYDIFLRGNQNRIAVFSPTSEAGTFYATERT